MPENTPVMTIIYIYNNTDLRKSLQNLKSLNLLSLLRCKVWMLLRVFIVLQYKTCHTQHIHCVFNESTEPNCTIKQSQGRHYLTRLCVCHSVCVCACLPDCECTMKQLQRETFSFYALNKFKKKNLTMTTLYNITWIFFFPYISLWDEHTHTHAHTFIWTWRAWQR